MQQQKKKTQLVNKDQKQLWTLILSWSSAMGCRPLRENLTQPWNATKKIRTFNLKPYKPALKPLSLLETLVWNHRPATIWLIVKSSSCVRKTEHCSQFFVCYSVEWNFVYQEHEVLVLGIGEYQEWILKLISLWRKVLSNIPETLKYEKLIVCACTCARVCARRAP